MVNVTVNGKAVAVPEHTTILEPPRPPGWIFRTCAT